MKRFESFSVWFYKAIIVACLFLFVFDGYRDVSEYIHARKNLTELNDAIDKLDHADLKFSKQIDWNEAYKSIKIRTHYGDWKPTVGEAAKQLGVDSDDEKKRFEQVISFYHARDDGWMSDEERKALSESADTIVDKTLATNNFNIYRGIKMHSEWLIDLFGVLIYTGLIALLGYVFGMIYQLCKRRLRSLKA